MNAKEHQSETHTMSQYGKSNRIAKDTNEHHKTIQNNTKIYEHEYYYSGINPVEF